MTPSIEHTSLSPEQTLGLGRALGAILVSGDFLALTGPLGSGKTQFVKGVAAGLEVPTDECVVSPTFVLVREYAGRLKLYHVDAYRLRGTAELLALGLDEMAAEPAAVVAIEWADRAPGAIPENACCIDLEHVDRSTRRLRIRWEAAERRNTLEAALRSC